MRRAALLVALLACSQPDQAPSPGPTAPATPAATPTEAPAPGPTATPGPGPAGDRPPAAMGADCASDADCATTTYGPEPAKDASGCCAALVCSRVETAKRAEELAAAFSKLCGAVRCRAPDCPDDVAAPVPACRAGRCVAR